MGPQGNADGTRGFSCQTGTDAVELGNNRRGIIARGGQLPEPAAARNGRYCTLNVVVPLPDSPLAHRSYRFRPVTAQWITRFHLILVHRRAIGAGGRTAAQPFRSLW